MMARFRSGHIKWLFPTKALCTAVIDGEPCGATLKKGAPKTTKIRYATCPVCGASHFLHAIGEEVRLKSGRHTIVPLVPRSSTDA